VYWIIICISIPVPRLHPLLLRYLRVRLDKPPGCRVIPSSTIVIHSKAALPPLASEQHRRRGGVPRIPLPTPRVIPHLRALYPAAVGGDGSASQPE
jgi:hypothetical protein